MSKKGWWDQVFYDDYPETKTDYGQFQYKEIKNRKPVETCPNCGKENWAEWDYCKDCRYSFKDKKLPTPKSKKFEREARLKIVCKHCEHEKIISGEFRSHIELRYGRGRSFSVFKFIRKNIGKFRCSDCGKKSVELIKVNNS